MTGNDVQRERQILVHARLRDVWRVVSDPERLDEWSGEYRRRHGRSRSRRPDGVFTCSTRPCMVWETSGGTWQRGLPVRWTLSLEDGGNGRTRLTESFEWATAPSLPTRLLRWRKADRECDLADSLCADLQRLKIIIEAPGMASEHADDLLTLLNVYTTQFGNYTTLLWQVPALGLTAQAFLLTIALGYQISDAARITASVLSYLIAIACSSLMHNQRGRALNQAELARRTSAKLALKDFLGGSFNLDDAVPRGTSAQQVWDVDHAIYKAWIICMCLFMVADTVIVVSVAAGWHLVS
jgi:hypothetical protein